MFSRSAFLFFGVFAACSACAENKRNEWQDIDYSKVYRNAGERQIDSTYRAPSVVGCVNDDLYLCQ